MLSEFRGIVRKQAEFRVPTVNFVEVLANVMDGCSRKLLKRRR